MAAARWDCPDDHCSGCRPRRPRQPGRLFRAPAAVPIDHLSGARRRRSGCMSSPGFRAGLLRRTRAVDLAATGGSSAGIEARRDHFPLLDRGMGAGGVVPNRPQVRSGGGGRPQPRGSRRRASGAKGRRGSARPLQRVPMPQPFGRTGAAGTFSRHTADGSPAASGVARGRRPGRRADTPGPREQRLGSALLRPHPTLQGR